jgi:hypothetical protein
VAGSTGGRIAVNRPEFSVDVVVARRRCSTAKAGEASNSRINRVNMVDRRWIMSVLPEF